MQHHNKKSFTFIIFITFSSFFFTAFENQAATGGEFQSVERINSVDREYILESTMLGYFAPDGARNPVLRANKGDRVRITIVNGEVMTHDIVMEKLGIRSDVIIEKGAKASIEFVAEADDVYFCSIPGHRAAGMVGKFEVVEGDVNVVVDNQGVQPMVNGRSLDFDFEGEELKGWKSTGNAFLSPLIPGNPSPFHKPDQQIGQHGTNFLSSGGTENYTRIGTLSSEPFPVTHPFASFLVSGGALQDTRVELVLAENNEVFYEVTGTGRATLQPVVVDLSPIMGKEIFIRLIDNETGISEIPYIADDVWGHINFDDFRFYSDRPVFANELKKEDIIVLPPLDLVQFGGLSGEEASKVMTLKEGFKVITAASEPDIVRPISFTLDSRGRLWVVEAHTYPVRAPEGEGRDRILIMEDTDGDGVLDKRIVFKEGLNLVSGIEVGMGGVWLGAAPYLLFIPIDESGDKPAGEPQILLDGWGYQDTHETLNNLHWGPDGWLYGTHGIFTHSNVGKPGARDEDRKRINAGIWRYHPQLQEFEVFSEGTSNPWGIDFNDYGHAFSTVCVIPHLFHMIQGARYQRQEGEHFNPYTYRDIGTIADHVHWVGDRGPHAGNFRSASAGGGHAHAGAMIYLGGNSWPKEYRETIFMNSINGARVNTDRLARKGSGYTAAHGEDFLLTNDSWSQWLNFRYDGSGSVFAIDWYDKNQCHSPNPDVHDKHLGRIFKISNENDKWVQVDLRKATDMELVNYQLSENDWYVRQSRLILQERGSNKKVHKALKELLKNQNEVPKRLRALWALHVTRGLNEKEYIALLSDQEEYIRSWTIQLLAENGKLSQTALEKMTGMAQNDQSPLVRLYLASAVQRIPLEDRWEILNGLYQHAEDAEDHNLPLMLWYAGEPLIDLDLDRAVSMAANAKISTLLEFTKKRLEGMDSSQAKDALRLLSNKGKDGLSGKNTQIPQELLGLIPH